MSIKVNSAYGKEILKLAGERNGKVTGVSADFEGLFERATLLPDPSHPADVKRSYSVLVEGWHPTTLNRLFGLHHHEASRRKKADAIRLRDALLAAGVPNARFHRVKREVSILLTLGPGQRSPDPDAWWKSTLDGLVRCGALVDDNPKWVELVQPRYCRAADIATRLVLRDL